MGLITFTCAIVTRALFILVALVGVLRVTRVKNDPTYWFLTFLFLPLVVEMIVTLKSRKGQDYKWFSPPILLFLVSIIPSIWLLELHHQQNKTINPQNIELLISAVCPNNWILALYQVSAHPPHREVAAPWEWSHRRAASPQLLLIFVGTARYLDHFSETLSDVKWVADHIAVFMNYASKLLSTIKFLCFRLSFLKVVNSTPSGEGEDGVQEPTLLARHSTDMWNIVEALFIQDGPFLVVRLTVMTYFGVLHQMLVFFAIKNFLVVILNLYRFAVICQDVKASTGSAVP
ncbi:transmembrane protein 26 [Lates japonicus]|uniref:Transmembrane protein 26 n=1 Tax=Lates japonicus TaxID=270547 RepID=A0AAD3N0S2_LATJO|nr:transmembrane protein 26 [Lates japonicus]